MQRKWLTIPLVILFFTFLVVTPTPVKAVAPDPQQYWVNPDGGDSWTENNASLWDSSIATDTIATDSATTQNGSYSIRTDHGFNDTFDNESPGHYPSQWSGSDGDNSSCWVRVNATGYSGKCIHVYDTNNPGYPYFGKSIAEHTAGYIRFYFYRDGSQDIFQYQLREDGTDIGVWLRVEGTDLKYFEEGAGSPTTIMTLSDKTWYKIEIHYDCASDTFDLEVGDVSKLTDEPFYEVRDHIDYTWFISGPGQTSGDWYIDEVFWNYHVTREFYYNSAKDLSLNCSDRYQYVNFRIQQDNQTNDPELRLYYDASNYMKQTVDVTASDTWEAKSIEIGSDASGWTKVGSESATTIWSDIDYVSLYYSSSDDTITKTYIDELYFDSSRTFSVDAENIMSTNIAPSYTTSIDETDITSAGGDSFDVTWDTDHWNLTNIDIGTDNELDFTISSDFEGHNTTLTFSGWSEGSGRGVGRPSGGGGISKIVSHVTAEITEPIAYGITYLHILGTIIVVAFVGHKYTKKKIHYRLPKQSHVYLSAISGILLAFFWITLSVFYIEEPPQSLADLPFMFYFIGLCAPLVVLAASKSVKMQGIERAPNKFVFQSKEFMPSIIKGTIILTGISFVLYYILNFVTGFKADVFLVTQIPQEIVIFELGSTTILFLNFVLPFIEESVFRFLVPQMVAPYTDETHRCVISAAVFGAFHYYVAQMLGFAYFIYFFAGGLIFYTICYGSLWIEKIWKKYPKVLQLKGAGIVAAIVVHLLFNFMALYGQNLLQTAWVIRI